MNRVEYSIKSILSVNFNLVLIFTLTMDESSKQQILKIISIYTQRPASQKPTLKVYFKLSKVKRCFSGYFRFVSSMFMTCWCIGVSTPRAVLYWCYDGGWVAQPALTASSLLKCFLSTAITSVNRIKTGQDPAHYISLSCVSGSIIRIMWTDSLI